MTRQTAADLEAADGERRSREEAEAVNLAGWATGEKPPSQQQTQRDQRGSWESNLRLVMAESERWRVCSSVTWPLRWVTALTWSFLITIIYLFIYSLCWKWNFSLWLSMLSWEWIQWAFSTLKFDEISAKFREGPESKVERERERERARKKGLELSFVLVGFRGTKENISAEHTPRTTNRWGPTNSDPAATVY